ncbi:MAG: PaaI family thioesterase [Caulobacteraceae bacterium]|nr:PaaI family thioesterase [Caulobacteraceae bacterium]
MSLETVLDRYPVPACARTLGLDILEARPSHGWVRIGFVGQPAFCNASGCVQGGFLAAMLDDSMGPAVMIATEGALYPVTIDMTVSFLAPARPGPLFGEAEVISLGKTIGFVEARLMDGEGALLAKASASVRLLPTSRLAG